MKEYFWAVFPVILVIGALVGGFFIYRAGSWQDMVQSQPFSSSVPTESPEASPMPKLKREDLKLQILNGAGVGGSAAKMKTYLENAGYENIAVGNADSYNFKTTIVQVKDGRNDYADLLINDLAESYEASVSPVLLDETSSFDVVVTVGLK